MRRPLLVGSLVSILVIFVLLGATLYANNGYSWPTEEEFKAEMVLVEAEYPGLLHTLLTVDNGYSADRWSRIEEAFADVDWDTWPWKEGAFYRQFNPPGWVEFFDSYELVPVVAMAVLAFVAFWFWRTARGTGARPDPPEVQAPWLAVPE
jgi:hypothetical protein